MTPSIKLRLVIAAALGLTWALLLAGPAPAKSGLPDLRVRSLSDPPAALAVGTRFTVRESTANVGGARAERSTTRHYLSLDRRPSRDDLRLAGVRTVRPLHPGTRVRGATKLSLSGDPAAGTYYLLACADDLQRVRETNERNNCRSSRGRTFVGRVLAGPNRGRVNSNLPNGAFPQPSSRDVVTAGGVPISTRDLIVIFRDRATVAGANSLLGRLGAEVEAGNPLTKELLLRLTGRSSLRRVLLAQHVLRASPLVAGASVNYALTTARIPPHNVFSPANLWTWEVPFEAASGNWGLKASRLPQAWNLFEHAARTNATIEALVVEVDENRATAVSEDVASSTHADLSVDVFDNTHASNHASMVAGFIGARWSNNQGVEGAYPRGIQIVSRGATFHGSLADTVTRVLGARRDVRVVNYSAGLWAWYRQNNIDPVNDRVNPARPAGAGNPTWRVQMDGDGTRFLEAFRNFSTSRSGRADWLMFCSAGNNRLRPGTAADYEARDESECNNIAVRGGGFGDAAHFLAVEATNAAGTRASFSASGGTLSAPGESVRSTRIAGYGTGSGTSFASPHAAGIAAYLWSLDPDLTFGQLRGVLTSAANRVAVGAGAQGGAAGSERVDAFAAAIGIDLQRNNKALQRKLADVDDGSVDGNQRIDPWTGAVNAGIANGGSRRGDGRVTMRDFRAFRDAYLQTHAGQFGGAAPAVDLDGAADHFKRDLNFDGCVGAEGATPAHPADVPARTDAQCGGVGTTAETPYPRYDFNGDGRLGLFPVTAPFKRDIDGANCVDNGTFSVIAPPGCLRDVDVLVDPQLWELGEAGGYQEHVFAEPVDETAYSDPEAPRWEPRRFVLGNRELGGSGAPAVLSTTPDYLHSYDLHLKIDWASFDPDIDKVAIRVSTQIWGQGEESFLRFVRVPRGGQAPIVTLPLWTGHSRVIWTAYDEDEPYVPSVNGSVIWDDVRLGQDRTHQISN